MKITISGKNIELTPAIKNFADDKVRALTKLISNEHGELAEARIELGLPSRHHKTGKIYYAEINLKIGSKLFRATEEHFDLNSAITTVCDELGRQLSKEKDRQISSRRVKKIK